MGGITKCLGVARVEMPKRENLPASQAESCATALYSTEFLRSVFTPLYTTRCISSKDMRPSSSNTFKANSNCPAANGSFEENATSSAVAPSMLPAFAAR